MKKALIGAIVCFMWLSCSTSRKVNHFNTAQSGVPLIEYFTIVDGQVLSGTPYPGKRIDSPGYSYDSATQTLDIYRTHSLDTVNVALFLGLGKVLQGASGQGVSSFVTAVNQFPFVQGELIVSNITAKGVNLNFKGKQINLSAGQTYTHSETRIDTLTENTVVKTTTTWRISHKGFVNKLNQ